MHCDLHTHSCFSDGTFTPKEIIEASEKLGLCAVALCDHNTVSGLEEFLAAAKGKNVCAVPGVEFSTDYNGTELHILALFVKQSQYGAITELMENVRKQKEKSNENVVAALCKDGYDIDINDIRRANPDAYINRAHIAAELTNKGYTRSVKEAFDTLLSPNGKYYVPPKRPDSFAIIRFIRSIGSVPVLAHPFLNLQLSELERFLKDAIAAGLCGMETQYTLFSDEESQLASELCKKHGLLESGGSDFHGKTKPDTALGSGKGELAVPKEFFDKIKILSETL